MLCILITWVFNYSDIEHGFWSETHSTQRFWYCSPNSLTLKPLGSPLSCPIYGYVIWNTTECHKPGMAVSPSFSFLRAVCRGLPAPGYHTARWTRWTWGWHSSSVADPEQQGVNHSFVQIQLNCHLPVTPRGCCPYGFLSLWFPTIEKGATEEEMVGWHHRLDGHEFEQTLGDSEA